VVAAAAVAAAAAVVVDLEEIEEVPALVVKVCTISIYDSLYVTFYF